MPRKPLISVMMPCYNSAKYLTDAINSIINQTYTNWELIIVDDGSTDNTREIVYDFINKGVNIKYKYIDHSGRGVARNECINLCVGEYVVVCDSDDISFNNRFEKLINGFVNDDIGVVSSYLYKITNNESLNCKNIIVSPVKSDEIAKCFENNKMCVHNASSMIRRRLFETYGMYNVKMLRAQDYEFFKRLHMSKVKFVTIPEPLVFYRQENLFPSIEYYMKSLCYIKYGDYLLSGGSKSYDEYYRMFLPNMYKIYLLIKYYSFSLVKNNLLRALRFVWDI